MSDMTTESNNVLLDSNTVATLNPSEDNDNSNKNGDSAETSQKPQSESTNILGAGIFKNFFSKDEDVPSVKVIFHVHLPSFEYVEGYPIIVGNIEELGNWTEPIVKLKQKKTERDYMHSRSSYWYSDPISIPMERFDNYEVKYNYAFFIPKKTEEKSIFARFKKDNKDENTTDSTEDKSIFSRFKKDEKNKDENTSDSTEEKSLFTRFKKDNKDENTSGSTAIFSKFSRKKPTGNENNDSKNNNEDDSQNNDSSASDGKKKTTGNEINDPNNNNNSSASNDKTKTTGNEDGSQNNDDNSDNGQDGLENEENKEDSKTDKKNKEEGDLYFEVTNNEQQRPLAMKTGFKFDIATKFVVKERHMELRTVRELVFPELVYNSIDSSNLKENIIEFQELLNRFKERPLRELDLEFVKNNIQRTKSKEKRIFLCLLVGYYIDWRQSVSIGRFNLPNGFPTVQIIDILEKLQPDILPEGCYHILNVAMTAVICSNVASRAFVWLKLFKVASIIDPNFTFIEKIQDLNYNNERVNHFLKEFVKSAKPVISQIENFETYSNIGRWLFNNCNSLETLLFVWTDIIDHTSNMYHEDQLLKRFRPCVEQLISSSHATTLIKYFSRIPDKLRIEVAEIFRVKSLSLLKNHSTIWRTIDSQAILQILKDPQLNWRKDEFLDAMGYISRSSNNDNLLAIFPDLLDYWYKSDFKDSKTTVLPDICKTWYHNLIDINGSESSNDSNFIFGIYKNLSIIFPTVGKHPKIFKELLDVSADRVKNCAAENILTITPEISTLVKEINNPYGEMVKEMLKKSIHKIDNKVITILLQVCGCKNEVLSIQNGLSQSIVYQVMTYLEAKDTNIKNIKDMSTTILNLLKTYRFWRLIFHATGQVEYLHSHSYVKQVREIILKFDNIIIEESITIRSLQKILDYDTNILSDFLNSPAKKEEISVDLIKNLRKDCHGYNLKMEQLRSFYDNFCPVEKVNDVQKFLDDINNRNKNLENLKLKDALAPNHWDFHKKNLKWARTAHKMEKSLTFHNIFNDFIKPKVGLTVENISQTLMPEVDAKHKQLCQQYREWGKLKCSEGSVLWKNVTEVGKELDLIKDYIQTEKSQNLIMTLKYLALVPTQIERLQQLSAVLTMFNVPHTKGDWLERLQLILRDDYLWLGKLVNFFDIFNSHLGLFDNDCWDLIKELSIAGEFIAFLHEIAEHDIKNLINTVDDSDERLIQEDTVSSLIQVKQFLLPLLQTSERLSIKGFLVEVKKITQQNAKLGSKVALCNCNNMALRNLYNNVSKKGEVTKEKIKSAVKKGTYTFERHNKGDTCKVTLTYPTKKSTKELKESTKASYSLTDLHDLRGRALLISKPSTSVDIVTNHAPGIEVEEEVSKPIMDEFVAQVDFAQEIINLSTKLIQTGHFFYRDFVRQIKGTENMQKTVMELKKDLKEWEEFVDEAQEDYYYLTFFPARHLLTFLDYFSADGDVNNNAEEECRKLIRFVNSKATLPPKKSLTINLNSNKYEITLEQIGKFLQGIFEKAPKEEHQVENIKERVISDVVYPGKLFVAACSDRFLVPNIIMSLYVNHGYYPFPWQILICTNSTTMEELSIFVKRCFFANKNGYKGILFCLANLELLDFELQYNLVEQIKSMREHNRQFQLALICYREKDLSHHILDQFSQDVHTTNGLSGESMKILYHELCPKVMSVSSELSGQGKTEWIRQSSFLKKLTPKSFLISDGIDFKMLVHKLKTFKTKQFESLHLNIISANHPEDVNMFLFELLTLGVVFCNMDVVSLPDTLVFIEVASTIGQHLFKSLPIAGYLRQRHLTWDIRNLIVSQEIDSPIQIVCHYLKALSEKAAINEKDIFLKNVENVEGTNLQPLSVDECINLINQYLFQKSAKDQKDVKEILSFRFIEIFVNVFADQLVRLSSSSYFKVENLKLMVEEQHIRSTLVQTLLSVSKDFATKSIATKEVQKANISTPENALGTIVQWDDSNHLLVFFLSQTPDSICALYRDKAKVPVNVKTLLKSQYVGDKNLWDLDDYHKLNSKALLSTLENLARKTMHEIKYPQYALSADNLIKMALILLRARANIPVIVCGEAGCGKTSLIGFLAKVVEVEFRALNLHAGVTDDSILHFMGESQEKAEKGEVWLFFDEINTCNHIGLLADLIAHRMLDGKPIHHNIRIFAACNPYRIRVKAATEAGIKKPRFEEKSKLVYQVNPLPDQILDYVWDYGILKPKEESKYIEIMINEQLNIKGGNKVLSECLFYSQEFIRKIEEPYSVSLRDVKRAITLVKFFVDSLENRPPIRRRGPKYPGPSDITIIIRSYILALGLCYQSRIYEQRLRRSYREMIGKIFKKHNITIDGERFNEIMREEQEDYINRMQCPPNTAKNEALLENVLVMIVCVLTKTPCFIIGAPGSSKSLAVRLIGQNLRGTDSNDEYFRKLPQIYLIPHQGSSSSTSEGIEKVFKKAEAYQDTSSDEFSVLSVVLLDEVGLAETSPFNPLKVLHSLLEPSYPNTKPTVSCVAISNWRLDNSKSSRALLVQRPKFELNDLIDTASRLLIKNENSISEHSLKLLAESYLKYEQEGQKLPNFHGLRDYYSLVKSLSQCNSLTPENIQMALVRNFGGIGDIENLIDNYFSKVIRHLKLEYSYKPIPILNLINANLEDKDARHLMVIGKSDSIVNLLNYQLRKKNLDPVVILGSQFPEDQDDYSYSVLSRIMMCVETGRPLILTDLEIIYGSLYDLWNQNYIVVGSEDDPKYYARVALGAYANPMLYVAPTFRCILVMDESKLEKADPPLLNRFEKQKMIINDTLTTHDHELVDDLKEWARLISTMTNKPKRFKQNDLFIGFDENETLQSLIIDVKKSFPGADEDEVILKCKEKLINIATSDGIIRAEKSNLGSSEVKKWKKIYFNEQHHDDLADHIQYKLGKLSAHKENDPIQEEVVNEGLQIIVNTFSNINTDVKSYLQNDLNCQCQVYKLSIFKTESDFQNRIKSFWIESQDEMLILQCDVTTISAGCIKLAKFLIEQYRNEYLQKKKRYQQQKSSSSEQLQDLPIKHVCIILHIHREQENSLASFNFMCGWDQVTIETLLPQEKSLSSLLSEDNLSNLISTIYPFEEILRQELLWCLLCIKYPSNIKSVSHIKMLNENICENSILVDLLKTRTIEWLKENFNNVNWQYDVASDKKLLYPYSSFANALLTHIRSVVRKPIAMYLYVLEKYAVIYTIILLYNKSLTAKGPADSTKGVEHVENVKNVENENDGDNLSTSEGLTAKGPADFTKGAEFVENPADFMKGAEYVEDECPMSEEAYLLEFWNKMVNDVNIISIKELKIKPSPDSYIMPHGIYELEFPFSYYIMEKIDDSRRIYEEELLSLYNDQENVDKTTGELYDYTVEEYNKRFISNIENFSIIKNSPIANYPEKYFKDFINVILSNEVNGVREKEGNLDEELLKFIFKRKLDENVSNPVRLHSHWWKNSTSILAELALAQISPNVITQIGKEDEILLEIEFEKRLVEQVIRNLLNEIINTKEEGPRNRLIIERWQGEVTKVLSLCEKIEVTSKLYSLQLLRICNDLLITKSIPLNYMKQLIKYAQQRNVSDEAQNEIISKEFIDVVMKMLVKLEPNEKNLIPRRLFLLRCLDMLTLESPVRLFLYKGLFSSSPFPLMGAIIIRIFRTEEKENPGSILQLVQKPREILRYSGRLHTINECFDINSLNTMMATLVCDTFQQEFFSKLELITLINGFSSAIGALYANNIKPLQRIASIAFLKEFVKQFWNYLIKDKKDYTRPITYVLLDVDDDFNGNLLVEQLNNTMTIAHPLINAFKLYLLRELRINREFSNDDIKKFCESQSKTLDWFNNFDIDKNESKLPFNPYWAIPDYGKLEIAFTLFYNNSNRSQFDAIFKQYNSQKPSLSKKLGLFGVVVAKLHSIRAFRDWRHNENQINEYLKEQINGLTTISDHFKATLLRVMENKHLLLKMNDAITNSELLIKSVIAHIIGLHILLEPNTTPLSIYMHRIGEAREHYILTCQSDIESIVLSAIASKDKVSRYSCQCGYKYLIGECGKAWTESKCPECNRTIGGKKHVTASGNERIDTTSKNIFEANDQKGYISEDISKDINYTVRDMPPVAYRILHLIVHTIICSQAPSQMATNFIQQHNKNYTNVEAYCMEHILNDWDVLKKILNCSDENLALTFHSIITTLTDNPPTYSSTLSTPQDRNQWETIFTKTCVLQLTRNVNESSAQFRALLEQNMKKADIRSPILEEQINQTNLMDENYCKENLPSLWRIIGKIDYKSFRAYYISDPRNIEKYPFLHIFFKYSKDLPLIKYLYPMVKFIQLLNTRLGYKLTRDQAKNKSFREIIENESNDDVDKDSSYNALSKSFNEFKEAYNVMIDKVKRYQCHNLPQRPKITDRMSVVYGLIEGKDEGIYLCAILEYLINIQNGFLGEIISIPPGTCDSLRFLQSPSWDNTVSTEDSPYFVRTMRVDRAIESNFIIYEWNEEVLQYSQRNLSIGKGQDIIYDLQRIECELANTLVYNKVHFESGNEQLMLDPFPYHLELISSSMRILGDIKSLIPQEQIPSDQNSIAFSKDNASELLSLLEVLLCFIKRTSIDDGELLLNEFIKQWVYLSSLTENTRFKIILSYKLQLKHIVSLYEIIEEQVADIMIQLIDNKFKGRLTDEMKKDLDDAIGFDGEKEKIPADSFIIAMKRFIQRVLQTESDKETHPLHNYLTDMSLNLWPSNNVIEEILDVNFPKTLFVANSFTAYEYVSQKKKEKQQYSGGKIPSDSSPSQPTQPPARKGKKPRVNKYDAM